ncbi:MAG: PAS domain-containing protein [Rhizobacter sp.]|nr:PAS domain-containing protein [Rhizobacter sp.]
MGHDTPPAAPAEGTEAHLAARLAATERQLAEVSRQLALAQAFGRMAIIERDIRTGHGHWSPEVYALYGFDPALGTPHFDTASARMHPEDRERVIAGHMQFIKQAGRYETRFRILLPNGDLRYVHSLSEVSNGADGAPQFMTSVLIDDTEEVLRQQAAGRENAHLATTLEMTGLSAWRLDPAANRIDFNDAGYRAMSMAPPAQGMSIDEIRAMAHPDDREGLAAAADAALASDAPVDFRARYINPDGSYRTLITRRVAQRDESGRVQALLGVSFDISAEIEERERAEALALSMKLISDAVGVGLWTLDLDTGVVEWNAQMYRLYGLHGDEPPPPAAHWMEALAHPDDRTRVARERRRSRDAGELDFETDFRIRQADGSWRWVACRSRRTLRNGRPTLYGIHLDIHKAKLAEQALRDKAAAEQASKAKSDFLAHMSHELRTPLNAVIGFSQLLAHDGVDALSPAQRERAQRIEAAGNHLLALIDDVLDLASIEAGSLPVADERVDLADLLRDVMQWMEPQARAAEVELRATLPTDGAVRADARRLRQVLTNLMSNAVKYNRPQGWVQLHATAHAHDGADGWELAVADNGPGLSEQQQRGLYEPFNRLGAERGGVAGTGIGLTIARRLVDRMGGQLDVRSAPGAGCEFRVWLPAALRVVDAAPAPSAQAADAAPPAPASERTDRLDVLCIEDDPTNLLLVQELIALRPRIAFRSAPDGETGLRRALDAAPDVMLVDMHLPDFDGLEVLRRVREAPALRHTVCIALSANAMAEDMARARTAGFADYWTKPIAFEHFLAQLDALLDGTHPAQQVASSA